MSYKQWVKTMSVKRKTIIAILIFMAMVIAVCVYYMMCWPSREYKISLSGSYPDKLLVGEREKEGAIILETLTEQTVEYQNNDGTRSYYVFAAPIAYDSGSGMKLIDTRLKNVEDTLLKQDGYRYMVADSDIKSYYPEALQNKNGIIIWQEISYEFGNMGAESTRVQYKEQYENFVKTIRPALCYSNAISEGTDLYVYPTSLGVGCELDFRSSPKNSSFSLWLRLDDRRTRLQKDSAGYIKIIKNYSNEQDTGIEEIKGIIHVPMLKDVLGNLTLKNTVDIEEKGNGEYLLQFTLDQDLLDEGAKAFISFEMRREKQPDSTVYSLKPQMNSYLSPYTVIGHNTEYGKSRTYIRYEQIKESSIPTKKIESVVYHTYNLSNSVIHTGIYPIQEEWCSLTVDWYTNISYGKKISNQKLKTSGPVALDIIDPVRNWIDDTGNTQEKGLLLMSEDSGYSVLASSDSSLYPVNTEIIYQP